MNAPPTGGALSSLVAEGRLDVGNLYYTQRVIMMWQALREGMSAPILVTGRGRLRAYLPPLCYIGRLLHCIYRRGRSLPGLFVDGNRFDLHAL